LLSGNPLQVAGVKVESGVKDIKTSRCCASPGTDFRQLMALLKWKLTCQLPRESARPYNISTVFEKVVYSGKKNSIRTNARAWQSRMVFESWNCSSKD